MFEIPNDSIFEGILICLTAKYQINCENEIEFRVTCCFTVAAQKSTKFLTVVVPPVFEKDWFELRKGICVEVSNMRICDSSKEILGIPTEKFTVVHNLLAEAFCQKQPGLTSLFAVVDSQKEIALINKYILACANGNYEIAYYTYCWLLVLDKANLLRRRSNFKLCAMDEVVTEKERQNEKHQPSSQINYPLTPLNIERRPAFQQNHQILNGENLQNLQEPKAISILKPKLEGSDPRSNKRPVITIAKTGSGIGHKNEELVEPNSNSKGKYEVEKFHERHSPRRNLRAKRETDFEEERSTRNFLTSIMHNKQESLRKYRQNSLTEEKLEVHNSLYSPLKGHKKVRFLI